MIRTTLAIVMVASPAAAAAAPAAHEITVSVLDRQGRAPLTADAGYVSFRSLDGKINITPPMTDGHLVTKLPAGRYVVATGVYTPERTGPKSLTIIYRPGLDLRRDRSLTLDARQGRLVSVRTDRPDARMVKDGGYGRVLQMLGGKIVTTAHIPLGTRPTYLTLSGRAPGLALLLQGRLTKNGALRDSPYIYNLAGRASPADPSLRVHTSDLAVVKTRYAAQGRPGCASTYAGVYWPGGGGGLLFPVEIGRLPATRTEFFSPRTKWDSSTGITTPACDFAGAGSVGGPRWFPRPGSYVRDMTTGPYGPGPDWNTRFRDGRVQFWVPMFSSSSGVSGLAPYPGTTGRTVLRDAAGKTLATSDQPGYGEFRLPPRRAAYRVTADARRRVPWSDLAVRQHVEWTFSSGPPTGQWSGIPLLAVRYRTPLDAYNRARRGADQRIELLLPAAAKVRRLTLQVSFDDGGTWRGVAVRKTTRGGTAIVRNPSGSAHVSLRAFASDTVGRTVDQTVIRAYGLG